MTNGERAMRLATIKLRVKVLRTRLQRSIAARARWEERQRELGLAAGADDTEDVGEVETHDVLLDGLPDSI